MRLPYHSSRWAFDFLKLCALALIIFLTGCGTGAQEQPNPTLTALSLAISGTSTAEKVEDSSGNELATAEAKATVESENVFATQTAQSVGQDQSSLATATIAAPIVAELPVYGLDETSGKAGWVHNPLTLETTGYQEMAFGNDFMNVTAADFVLASDINWDTQYGSSACGFMFRSNGDQNKPSQYMVLISRFANGRAIFTAVADGEIANFADFYPKDNDKSFDWQNGATNRLAIVARGPIIEVYTNGEKIGEVDTSQPPKQPAVAVKPKAPVDQTDQEKVKQYKEQLKEYEEILAQSQTQYQAALKNYQEGKANFTEGFLGMLALSESGHTICRFENAWLWLIEP
jgi:outer membrane lipopolysaccharide assembly protein LptE/RlpB